MVEFHKKLEVSEEDYIEFNLTHYRNFRIKPVFLWIIVLIIASLLSVSIVIRDDSGKFTTPSAIGIVIFTLVLFTIAFWIAHFITRYIMRYFRRVLYKWAYKKNVKFKEAEITFNDKGIESRNEKTAFSVVWDQIQKLVETENAIYFYYNKNAAFLFPKRCLDSLDELAALRDFAKEKTQLEIKYVPLDKR